LCADGFAVASRELSRLACRCVQNDLSRNAPENQRNANAFGGQSINVYGAANEQANVKN